MSLYELQKHRVFGLVLGLVTDNKDPEQLGRVKVMYHMLDQQVQSDWCRLVTFYAGPKRGVYWVPEVNDEVVIGFEHGDVNFPYIIGSVWNGVDKPKDGKSGIPGVKLGSAYEGSTSSYNFPDYYTEKNDRKVIHTRSGHTLIFDDTEGKEKVILADSTRKNVLTMDVPSKSVTFDCLQGDFTFNVPEGKMTINAKNLNINVMENIKVKSGKDSTWKADGLIKHEAGKTMTFVSKLQWHAESQSAGMSLKASATLDAQAAMISEKATGFFVMKGSIIKLN